MNLDARLAIDLIQLLCLFLLVRGYAQILEKIRSLETKQNIEKSLSKEEDIQTNLGRRLLEIQEGRYARPYPRNGRGEKR